MMSQMMMPRSEIKSVEVYDQEWDPTVPNGYEMFDVSLIPSCLGSHADILRTQKVFHLKRIKVKRLRSFCFREPLLISYLKNW